MAMYDNKNWLLRNIRSSFISADTTGTCEEILSSDNIAKSCYEQALNRSRCEQNLVTRSVSDGIVTEFDPYPNSDDSDKELPLTPGMFGFEEGNSDRKIEDKVERIVEWQTPKQLTGEELEELLPRKHLRSDIQRKKSIFTETLIEEVERPPQLTYAEYLKFDGTANYGHHTFSFKIFVLLVGYATQQNALNVCVINSATFEDLIGLVCYKISTQDPNIKLNSVQSYALSIADEDGDIIREFSHLDPQEKCSANYGHMLCLIEQRPKYNLSTEDFMDSRTSSMSSVFEADVNWNSQDLPHGMAFIEVPLIKVFQVKLQQKRGRNVDVNLHISDKKIHVVPCQNKLRKMWGNMNPKTHDNNDIISWDYVSSKNNCQLRLKYRESTTNLKNITNDQVPYKKTFITFEFSSISRQKTFDRPQSPSLDQLQLSSTEEPEQYDTYNSEDDDYITHSGESTSEESDED